MGINLQPRIVVVTRETRMEGLLKRWSTKKQANFVFQRNRVVAAANAGQMQSAMVAQTEDDLDFLEIEDEDSIYREGVQTLVRNIDFGWPVQVLDRQFLPTLDFEMSAVVVVIGPDGLVANTAKYVGDTPIVAVNPDPSRIDGVLLPYTLATARRAVSQVIEQQAVIQQITLAEAELHDGQRLMAFNDFFIGAKSHVSARYELHVGSRSEEQSSSGVLVSTGAGSTGWMSSLYNMAAGFVASNGNNASVRDESKRTLVQPQVRWEDRNLLWAVREPFLSRTSGISLIHGQIGDREELVLESRMPSGGVIFSDGIESDYLEFNGGAIAKIRASSQCARLVVPKIGWRRTK